MITYRMHLETLQPLLISDRFNASDQIAMAQDHIPGQTLRGAMAASLLQFMDETDPLFKEEIVAQKLAFSPAYLTSQDPGDEDVWGHLPATARTCKRFPGTTPLGQSLPSESASDKAQTPRRIEPYASRALFEREAHFLHDALLSHWPWSQTKPAAPASCQAQLTPQITCDAPWSSSRGYFQLDSAGKARRSAIQHQMMTRTAIDARIDSVASKQLFSLRPLAAGQFFTGFLSLPSAELFKPLSQLEHLYLGMGRTRGFGKVALRWFHSKTPLAGRLENRLANFKAMLEQRNQNVPRQETHATLNLWSPLLLRDAFGEDRLELLASDLKAYGPSLAWEVAPVAVNATWVGGWHGMLQLPRSQRRAIAPGSVFALRIRGDRSEALAALARVEQFGLGEGFADGHGRILACHPFHVHYATKEVHDAA